LGVLTLFHLSWQFEKDNFIRRKEKKASLRLFVFEAARRNDRHSERAAQPGREESRCGGSRTLMSNDR